MTKLIIFDLGGVVTTPEVEHIDERVADYIGINLAQLKDITSGYKSALTKGEMTLKEAYSHVVDKLNLNITSEEILVEHLRISSDIFTRLNQTTLSIIKKLKHNYNVVALANTELEIIPISEKAGIYSPFEKKYISCEMGMQKPDEKIYRKVLNDYNCAPQDAMFIDDKLENILGAKNLGIKTIHYIPHIDLEAELKLQGIRL